MAVVIIAEWTCEECGNTESEEVKQDIFDSNLDENLMRPMGWTEIDKDNNLRWTVMCGDCADKWEEEHPDEE